MGQVAKNEVLELMQEKDKIENQIKQLTQILTLNGVNMKDPLVDNEGFPLSGVDVYQVRHARQKIICLQNDHTAIMKQIEHGLECYYNSTDNETIASSSNGVEMHSEVTNYNIPFAKITVVTEGSPSAFSGLMINDEIVEFGSINSTNFRTIADIATVVQHSEGQELNLKILRGSRFVVTQLTPRKWNGRGLLGCNIVSI